MKAIAIDGHSNNVDADEPKSNLQLPSDHPSHRAPRFGKPGEPYTVLDEQIFVVL